MSRYQYLGNLADLSFQIAQITGQSSDDIFDRLIRANYLILPKIKTKQVKLEDEVYLHISFCCTA